MTDVMSQDGHAALLAKQDALDAELLALGSVCVAFSGGVDSTYLLERAFHVLSHDAVLAVLVESDFLQAEDKAAAISFCERCGIPYEVVSLDVLSDPMVSSNPPDRCYHCKKAIFSAIEEVAQRTGAHVVDGSNVDDEGDYRPGMKALSELAIESPLRSAGLTKADIRALSQQAGLPTWDKPSSACLASRVSYGQALDRETLAMVDQAERLLHELGFQQVRVRVHGSLARIEVESSMVARLAEAATREKIVGALHEMGFAYVTLDLQGYRVGSQNEVL